MSQPVHTRNAGEGKVVVFQCDNKCDNSGHLCAAGGIGTGNAVAKDISLFEKLIERSVCTDASELADPSVNLKRLLKAA